MTGVLTNEGRGRLRTYREEVLVKTEAERWARCGHKLRGTWSPRGWSRQRRLLLWRLQGKWPCQLLDLGLPASRTVRKWISVV